MKSQTLEATAAYAVEQAEVDAWIDFYNALPKETGQALDLQIARYGKVVMTHCSRIPFLLFNRVINLGMGKPADEGLLDRLLGRFREFGVDSFAIHVIPQSQPSQLQSWLAGRGLSQQGGWDRIVRGGEPLAPAPPDPDVEEIGPGQSEEWCDLLFRYYGIPVQPWLRQLIGRPGWHHFALRSDGTLRAARSMYINSQGAAWLGVEAPVPGVMAPSFGDDARISRALVERGLSLGVNRFVTDVEDNNPDHRGPAYEGFEALGFGLAYLRSTWRPKA